MGIVRTYTAQAAITPGAAVQHDPANPGEVLMATLGTVAGGQVLVGVSRYGAEAGDPVDVVMDGEILFAEAGAAITWGTDLALTVFTGAGGQLTPAAAGDVVVAYYVGNGDRAAGEKAEVLVKAATIF